MRIITLSLKVLYEFNPCIPWFNLHCVILVILTEAEGVYSLGLLLPKQFLSGKDSI